MVRNSFFAFGERSHFGIARMQPTEALGSPVVGAFGNQAGLCLEFFFFGFEQTPMEFYSDSVRDPRFELRSRA